MVGLLKTSCGESKDMNKAAQKKVITHKAAISNKNNQVFGPKN
jgi:hypothetical protein